MESLVKSLQQASAKSDVRDLINQHGRDPVLQAWKNLSPVEKAALRLVHDFDGIIIHDNINQ